jgi:hypothetical protein
MQSDWFYLALFIALAVQSTIWLLTFVRILRLAEEISSASTIIVTLRDLCHERMRDGGGEMKKENSEKPSDLVVT